MVHCGNNSSMAKVGANGEVYAVLLEGNLAENGPTSSSTTTTTTSSSTGSRRSDKGKCLACRWLPACLGWSLLVAVTATCVVIVAFQLWATWQLQEKVVQLQAQIDSLSALDLEELRSQLRDLYDLRDLNTEKHNGLPGHPTSGDEDQEENSYAENPLSDFGTVTGEETTERGIQSEESESDRSDEDEPADEITDEEESDDDEDDDDDDDDDDDGDDNNESDENQTIKGSNSLESRRKRQADLSTHTKDGIPIYDRGYGVNFTRTEGLRIYESLLSSGGRGEPRAPNVNWSVTENPIQPHHRQNSIWRGRREKQRDGKTTVAYDSSLNPQFDPVHEYYPRSSTPRSSVAPKVEYLSSRVKPSKEIREHSTPSPVQGDQKSWPTSRHSDPSTSYTNHRVSLNKPVSSSTKRNRHHGISKVNQPHHVDSTLLSRDQAEIQATADKEDTLPIRSRTHHKVRVGKKQLRELNHVPTAIHLVGDNRNASDSSVEIASRNELGLHASWKLASWHASQRSPSLIKIDGATLTVKQSGLYFVYSQVHYFDEHALNAYEVFVNTEPFLRCVTTCSMNVEQQPKANTCYTAGAIYLKEGDKLFLRDIEPLRYSVIQPSKTFFGLIRLAPVAD